MHLELVRGQCQHGLQARPRYGWAPERLQYHSQTGLPFPAGSDRTENRQLDPKVVQLLQLPAASSRWAHERQVIHEVIGDGLWQCHSTSEPRLRLDDVPRIA